MGANFDSFPPNCHPEPDSGSQDFDIQTSIWRFRNKFGMTGVFCHPELVSGSQDFGIWTSIRRFRNKFGMTGRFFSHPRPSDDTI